MDQNDRHFKKRYLLIPFVILVLVFGVFVGSRFVRFANSVSKSQEGAVAAIRNTIGAAFGGALPGLKKLDQSKVSQVIQNKQSINILLLGYGGGEHSGTFLTDSIIVAHLDFASGRTYLISIPRDLWVKIPTSGYDGPYSKINAAYADGIDEKSFPNKLPQFDGQSGAGNLAKYVVGQVTGLHIDYYASIDFSGFKEVVDALGGVSVNVENSFTDYSYPNGEENVDGYDCSDSKNNPNSNCKYKVVHFDKGLQFMDGEKALEYSRSRHALGIEGSDFARSRRQQLLIAAIEDRALRIGAIPHIFDLMDSIEGHFVTDLSVAEIQDLAAQSSSVDLKNAEQISLTDSNAGLLVDSVSSDGQWILLPAEGRGKYFEIQNAIKTKLQQ